MLHPDGEAHDLLHWYHINEIISSPKTIELNAVIFSVNLNVIVGNKVFVMFLCKAEGFIGLPLSTLTFIHPELSIQYLMTEQLNVDQSCTPH